MRTHTTPHPHLPEDLCSSIAAAPCEPDHRFSRLSDIAAAATQRTVATAPFRPSLRTPLLLTAL